MFTPGPLNAVFERIPCLDCARRCLTGSGRQRKGASMKFQRHLDGFRDYLRAHHFAARTLETYGTNTKRFLAFLEQRYPRIDTVEQVTKDTILDYQRHLAEHEDPRIGPLTHATQNLILRSVRKFFHYLLRGDFILRDPTSVLEFPKEEQKLIRNVLSEDEVSGLLEQIKPIGPEGLRNRAIVELLYACGIRTTELCRLRVADVDLKEQTVTIMKGKGGKSRRGPHRSVRLPLHRRVSAQGSQILPARTHRRSWPVVPIGLGQPLQRQHYQPLGDVEDRHRGGAQERPDLLYVSPFGGDPSSAEPMRT